MSTSTAHMVSDSVLAQYQTTRAFTHTLVKTLSAEDMTAQSMPDASPVKWHLAHTSWFFETFLLLPYLAGYQPYNPAYSLLFNSYYQSIGPQFARAARGTITRPGVAEIMAYRQWVDQYMTELLGADSHDNIVDELTMLGIQHEQQHQELILTDLKYLLSCNPLYPAYQPAALDALKLAPPLRWVEFAGGIYPIGWDDEGFAFDNESPRHQVLVQPFTLASRLVTNGEYLEFMQDGGYQEPRYWLADGWSTIQREGWQAPLYWLMQDGAWHEFTLHGMRPLRWDEPVCHVSFYEANAYANWIGKRLPTEMEWEIAASAARSSGRQLCTHALHPQVASTEELSQVFGELWQWTASAYLPYPGYKAQADAIGEYNGKFMCNQMVLRGSACTTPAGHARRTYRNFFPPAARWQFSGIRLAE